LHKIDHDGNIVLEADVPYGVNGPGFIIHGAIHAARPDIQCIIHAHTRAGVSVSAMKCGLLPLSLGALRFHGRVSYHDCEGPVVNLGERERLVRDLGTHSIMFLRNHGTLVCAATVEEAFNRQYILEGACKIQVDVLASNCEIVMTSEEVAQQAPRLFEPEVRRAYGLMEWGAMMRMLDREDPSYMQ
jgi:ribulose-5-phosphate 4-epimerase/fuculose-1-phosphate aldolase